MATAMQPAEREKTPRAPQAMLDILARLIRNAQSGVPQMADSQASIPVDNYLSVERCQRERDVVFRRFPLIVGHDSELPEAGSTLRHDGLDLPMLLTRDGEGRVRAFLNVCRHRGMRLQKEQQCQRKTLVCPYHGWTYNLDGSLKHVPHDEFFPAMDKDDHGLTELPCEVKNGLIWVLPTPGEKIDVGEWLGSISDDLSYLGFDDFVQYRKTESLHDNNWKLIIDAFLEAYHVKVLHRNSVYPFFLDSMAISETVNRHMRSSVARRRIEEAASLPPEQWDFREHCSMTHFIFPNCITVNHPDYSSVLTFYPVAVDKMRWVHHMLIPAERNTEAEQTHWENTFNLIHETVFRAEDVDAAEQIQAGLASGANTDITLGRMEYTIRQFHESLQQALDEADQVRELSTL